MRELLEGKLEVASEDDAGDDEGDEDRVVGVIRFKFQMRTALSLPPEARYY